MTDKPKIRPWIIPGWKHPKEWTWGIRGSIPLAWIGEKLKSLRNRNRKKP